MTPLCFANAEDFRRRALTVVDQDPGQAEWLVLNAESNVVDLTAPMPSTNSGTELLRRGIVFAMARSNKTCVNFRPPVFDIGEAPYLYDIAYRSAVPSWR